MYKKPYVEGLENVGLHFGHGRGGEGHEGHSVAERVADSAQQLVLGPEVVAPLRNAEEKAKNRGGKKESEREREM